MKRTGFFFGMLFMTSGIIISQSQSDMFHIVFYHDFNNNSPGDYREYEWGADWNYPEWANHDIGYGYIIEENGNKFMRESFPPGTFELDDAGVQWPTPLDNGYDELYLTYRVKFSSGFTNTNLQGKLPGLSGGNPAGGGYMPDGTDGWSARFMFHGTNPRLYLYHPELYLVFGDTVPIEGKMYYGEAVVLDANLNPGTEKWFTLTQRVVLNTPGYHDGLVEAYINGKLAAQKTGIRWRDIPALQIDKLYISNFLGGSGEPTSSMEYIYFDDFYVYYYKDGIDVPRGNNPSPSDRELISPYKIISDSIWKNSISGNALTARKIIINWDNYTLPGSYTIERKAENDSLFIPLITLQYGLTEYTDDNLQPQTIYHYRIKIKDIYSREIAIQTQNAAIPNKPTWNSPPNITKNRIDLSWNDNSTNELGFEIERSVLNENYYEKIASLGNNIRAYTDDGLNPATSYYYRIRSFNEEAFSEYSSVLNVTTVALQPPSSPTNLTAIGITKNSVTLHWEDNANNEKGYRLFRSMTSETGYNNIAIIDANTEEYTDSGLEPNITYYYKINAYNEDGNSIYSNELETTTLPLLPPNPPTNLESTYISHNSTTLEWIDNSDNESGFQIFRTFADNIDYQLIHTTIQDINIYTDSLLLSDTAYIYRIRAFNDDGFSSYTNNLSVTTLPVPPPKNPSGLASKEITKNSVIMSWIDNSDDEDGFEIEKSKGNDDLFRVIDTIEADVTEFHDYGLFPGSTYYYRIRAFNQIGYSGYSNIIHINTLPLEIPVPPVLESIDILSESYVKLKWKDYSNNESGFRIERADDSSEFVLIHTTGSNDTVYTDSLLNPGINYYYRIKSFNNDGFSSYSNVLGVLLEKPELPAAPSYLKAKTKDFNSITLEWTDNSENETGFIIKRAHEHEKEFKIIKTLHINETSFTDKDLESNNIYCYMVNAINNTGESVNSNTAIASTMSISESNRIWEGLVAYYNFSMSSDNIVHDFSNQGEPLELVINEPSKVLWENNNKLEILSDTYIKSVTPATKIIKAFKETNEITLECWLKPSYNDPNRTSDILNISNNNDDIGANIAQEHVFSDNPNSYNYLIRLKTKATALNGAPNLYSCDELSYLSLHHLVYVKNYDGQEKIYLNGEEVANGIRPESFENWKDNYSLILGNNSDLNSPWHGTYYIVAIYNVALTSSQIINNYDAGPADNLSSPLIEYKLEISPNPSDGLVRIKIIPKSEYEYGNETTIQINDLMGTAVFSEIIEDPCKEQIRSYDFSHFPKGIYILRILTNNGFSSERFIIK